MAAADDVKKQGPSCPESEEEPLHGDSLREEAGGKSSSFISVEGKRGEDEDSVSPVSIGVGLCIGVAWGVAIDKLALGIAFGLCMGVAFGSLAGFWKKR